MARWTAERVEQLTSLAAEGLSAKAIGGEMGVSKNSIISACSRKGIKLENVVGWSSTNDKATTVAAARTPKSKQRQGLTWRPASPPVAPRPIVESAADRPVNGGKRLLELAADGCRWPSGEGVDMVFCGAPAVGPYCAGHAARSRIKGTARSF